MIELTPQQQAFIRQQIELGEYRDPAEVVGAALELLRERAADREYREDAASIERGLADVDAGRATPVDEGFELLRRRLNLPAEDIE